MIQKNFRAILVAMSRHTALTLFTALLLSLAIAPTLADSIKLLSNEGWSLLYVDSEENNKRHDGKYLASNAFDGDANTIWHTQWRGEKSPSPHDLRINLGESRILTGFRYLPRQDRSIKGTVIGYQFFVTDDLNNWGELVAHGTFTADKTKKEVRFDPIQGRYIRFIATKSVNDKPWTSVAEIELLEGEGEIVAVPPQPILKALDKNNWSLVYVDSEETHEAYKGKYLARNAFDGNPNTIWHTQWKGARSGSPHELQIDLGESHLLAGLRYLPRQDNSLNGTVIGYQIFISQNLDNWGNPVAEGVALSNQALKEVYFKPTAGRYIRFVATKNVANQQGTSLAELGVLKVVEEDEVAPLRVETGTVNIDDQWRKITFKKRFKNPVLITGIPSDNSKEGGIVQTRKLNNQSFELKFQEWSHLDQTHPKETLDWMVVESGVYTLNDGTTLEAGQVEQAGTIEWLDHTFKAQFNTIPRLFVSLQSANDSDAVTANISKLDKLGFHLSLLEEEARNDGHGKEQVGYLAIANSSGKGLLDGIPYSLKNRKINAIRAAEGALYLQQEQPLNDIEQPHQTQQTQILKLAKHLFAQHIIENNEPTVALRRAAPRNAKANTIAHVMPIIISMILSTTDADTNTDTEIKITPNVKAIGSESISLVWNVNNSNTVAKYRVLLNDSVTATIANKHYVIEGLNENTTYNVVIQALDSKGKILAQTDALMVKTELATAVLPTKLKMGTISSASVELKWQAPTKGDVSLYSIYRNGVLLTTVTDPYYIDSTLEADTSYQYFITVTRNGVESKLGASLFVTTPKILNEPLKPVSGAMLAETCSGCHGTDGYSEGPATPVLAGIDKNYFVSVMQDFRDDVRHATIMNRIAKAYSNDELTRMSEYFSGLDYRSAQQTVNQEQRDFGQTLHEESCYVCHTNQGQDRDKGILAGQWLDYLRYTLDDFATERSKGVPAVMTTALSNLTTDERDALAHFYASIGADSQAPSAPEAVKADAITKTSISLSWTNGETNSTVVTYEVEREGKVIAKVEKTDFIDNGLVSGEIYSYRIIAIDSVDNRSLPSPTLSIRTTGAPVISDPRIENGRTLWETKGCQNCHGVAKKYTVGANAAKLVEAIDTNKGGMGQFSELSAQERSDISAYIQFEQNNDGGDDKPKIIEDVALLDYEGTLRKASILLAGRLPIEEEYQQSKTEQGLRTSLRTLMKGADFSQFILRTASLTFLPEGASFDNIEEDFPKIDELKRKNKRKVYSALRQEPIALVQYIVENDRPYSEILTADYTMVTPLTNAIYTTNLLDPFTEESDTEFRPARITSLSARTPELTETAYPHAGVLTTSSWLSRFPTTDTNRNRHRSAMVFKQFLGVDLEALGQRPLDDSANSEYLVPTMENPNCQVCHIPMEPIAGGFQHWGNEGQYGQGGHDSLSTDYKSSEYLLDQNNKPWYGFGDQWYRDMFPPGSSSKKMPGAHHGFGRDAVQFIDRTDWIATANTERNSRFVASNAIDGKDETSWRGVRDKWPQELTIDMGKELQIEGISYQPQVHSNGKAYHIGKYSLSTSKNGQDWTEVKRGVYDKSSGAGSKILAFDATLARYFKLSVKSVTRGREITLNEINALQPTPKNQEPYVENHNGGKDALQWMARELVNDTRFAKGAVKFWYNGLFGRKALEVPMNPQAPGYAQALAAFQTQDAVLEALATRFVASGLKVKDLLVDLVMSDLFRATASTKPLDETRKMELAGIGMGRLLDPDALDRKGRATVGGGFFNGSYTLDGLLYGGFDGGEAKMTPNQEMTATMLSIYESKMFANLCDGGLIKHDMQQAATNRQLLPYVNDAIKPERLEGDLKVEHRIWSNIKGRFVTDLESHNSYPDSPTSIAYLDKLEVPINVANNFGQRIRSLLVVPTTGKYRFWIAGDDYASLRLSTSELAKDLQQIASVPGWTRPRQWDRYKEQQSVEIELIAGQAYLIEAVAKERTGLDNLAVAWSGPNIEQQVISSPYLRAIFKIDPDQMIRKIKQNIVYLHDRLLGEKLILDSPEIERTYALFKEIYDNGISEESGVIARCEKINGSSPIRRAWNAVIAYLMSDARYLHE